MKQELANIKVKFNSYYKYRFTFANDDGYVASVGGIGDEIYRSEVIVDKEYTIQQIADEFRGNLYILHNGEVIHSESQ